MINRPRILLADDHELVRRGLISILNDSHPDWEIVAEASNGIEALELAEKHNPNVAILDLSMPGHTGLEVTESLMQSHPGIKVLILTMHAAEPVLKSVKRAGASAYMLKSEAPTRLVRAVESMLAGDPFFASELAHRPASATDPEEYIPVQYLLTPREIEVLQHIANSRSNKQLAGDLNLSVRTAESHRANILEKLGVESVGDLVKIAVRDGLV